MTTLFEKNKMRLLLTFLGLILVSALSASCSLLALIEDTETIVQSGDGKKVWRDSLGFENRKLSIGGTIIHYIDYGGSGRTIVFLTGLGNSAHIFDEFAPKFADKFHVIAITRRGFGESGKPKDGYDTERLTDDIKDLLDSLKLDKVILIGHSVAGDELSDFAARYPQRTEALIYLDAAYDRSSTTLRLLTLAISDQAPPAPPNADDEDKISRKAYREYLKNIYGVYWPMSEVSATRNFDSTGAYLGDVSSPAVNLKLVHGEKEPDYENIKAPALAIYAVERNLDTDFAWTKKMFIGRGAIETKAMRFLYAQQNWEESEREKLKEELSGVRIVEVSGASHYVFISHQDFVEKEIRNFLSELKLASAKK